MKLILGSFIVIVFLSGCSTAPEKIDLNPSYKIAIINNLPNKINFIDHGLTKFENSKNSVEDDKRLNRHLETRLTENVLRLLPNSNVSTIDFKKQQEFINFTESNADTLRFLQESNFDYVIRIEKAGIYFSNIGSWLLRAKDGGFLVFSKSLFGKHLNNLICAQYAIYLHDLTNGKFISGSHNITKCNINEIITEEINPENLTAQELSSIQNILIKHIDETIKQVVNDLFL